MTVGFCAPLPPTGLVWLRAREAGCSWSLRPPPELLRCAPELALLPGCSWSLRPLGEPKPPWV